jgi:hypothetical protein
MSFGSLMSAAMRLSASMEALAALGAELRLRREGLFSAPRVRQLLQEVVQGIDLLDKPARMPGCSYSDAAVLQAMGLTTSRCWLGSSRK